MSFYFDCPIARPVRLIAIQLTAVEVEGDIREDAEIPLRKTKRVEGTADTIGVDHTIIGPMAAPR
jgi:hypothetical protein